MKALKIGDTFEAVATGKDRQVLASDSYFRIASFTTADGNEITLSRPSDNRSMSLQEGQRVNITVTDGGIFGTADCYPQKGDQHDDWRKQFMPSCTVQPL